MNPTDAFSRAIAALDDLYFSRTGKRYDGAHRAESDEERRAILKHRVQQEKLVRPFRDVLHAQARKREGVQGSIDLHALNPTLIAEAVLEAANVFLVNPELEKFRKRLAEQENGAYYVIDTNERLASDEEDLFAVVQGMERRVVWDSNLPLPEPLDPSHAFILGQTFDHEGDFWLRAQVKRGNTNLFSFGIVQFQGSFNCLEIRRLTKEVVASINRRRASIPSAGEHYSPISRADEVQVIIESFLWGRERLTQQIAELRPYCPGSYHMSVLVARRCAALLLHEDCPELKPKIDEEWQKVFDNHPNVLGDTMLIQNALYFTADILTKDKGAQKMAAYCGLRTVNA